MTSYQRFGRFIEKERCFELTEEPPRKWFNALFNRIGDWEMWDECTHLGDGYIRIRDRAGNQLNLCNWDSKYVYVRDEDTGTVSCPFGEPAPTPVKKRSVRIYPGKHIISSRCKKLDIEQRIFAPLAHPVEIWSVTVRNRSDQPKTVSVFGYAMFDLSGTDSEGNGFWKENICHIDKKLAGAYCHNRLPGKPFEWANGFFATATRKAFVAGEGYRDHFLRQDFSVGSPRCLDKAYNCGNKTGYGPDCAGAVQCRLTIQPGESQRVDFVLGHAVNLDEAKTFMKGLNAKAIDKWVVERDQWEAKLADRFLIDVGKEHYNALFNGFIKHHLYGYQINKSGFRDNLQVDAALALCDLEAATDNFLRALASQKPSGEVPHGFRPLIRLTYADKPAWIFFTLSQLIKESGDWSLLDVEVPYLESDERGSVWEHAIRTMRYLAQDVGANGLCDQHHADWNDGLEATAEAGDRESVMVTEQFCYGLREMVTMALKRGDEAIAAEAQGLYDQFKTRLNQVAWDGQWYVRSICGDGYRIGSDQAPYGKIFQNTQSWAVLAGVADGERAPAVMDQVEKHLKTDIGYRICNPGWPEYDPRVGRMSLSMPGTNENGGCYNHAAGFKAVADCVLGRAELAWDTFCTVTPDSDKNPVSNSGAEPFTYVNSYSNFDLIYGKSGYGWRTGTAGWFTILLIEYILGARRDYNGLRIDPCLSKRIKKAKLTRTFRGATYHIEIDNKAGRCVGVSKLTCDGEKVDGTLLCHDGGEHQVKVTI